MTIGIHSDPRQIHEVSLAYHWYIVGISLAYHRHMSYILMICTAISRSMMCSGFLGSPTFCSTTPGYGLALFAQRGFGQKHPGHAILQTSKRSYRIFESVNWAKSCKIHSREIKGHSKMSAFSSHRPSK